MIQEMVKALMLIFVAEMGDKTQILAMAFATRFPVRKVLIGIGLGAFLNHSLAVVLGSYLSRLVPINTIQMIAGAAFVGFALWTLKHDKEEDEEEPSFKFGPVATVSLAFFLGELGDKTQLTAITLAADAKYPLMILAGTVSGMIATGALGIIIGKKLGDKIPELGIKLLAASISIGTCAVFKYECCGSVYQHIDADCNMDGILIDPQKALRDPIQFHR
jgi:putative Ca2+/H+ antiporter (TMEM165/GDT1 family)